MASKIVNKILDGATELFARQGYFGTTTREIALKADVTEPSIYRLFLTKEKLFEHCLAGVIERCVTPAQFELALSSPEAGDFSEALLRAVRAWYSSISGQSARLLMQAALSDNRQWSEMAYAPITAIIAVLAKSLARELDLPRRTAAVAARTLILALFHFKVARPMLSSTENERQSVEKTIEQWLAGLHRRP